MTDLLEPAPRTCLHAQVANALAWLGDDEEMVLGALDAAGVPGWPGHPHMDPLCRWFAAAVPDLQVRRDGARLRVWDGTDTAVVALPAPVREALARAAAGETPRLQLRMEPPQPLPGPHLEDVYPAEADAADPCAEADLDGEATCRVCGCTESTPCELESGRYGWCRWASGEELLAAGVDPMLGDVCTACVTRAAALAAPDPWLAEPPAPAQQYDTVTIPPVPAAAAAGTGDRGGMLVRVAVLAGAAAAAVFLLAAGGPAGQLAGATVALSWPVLAVALWAPRAWRRAGAYAARHRFRPAHAAGVVRCA